MIQAIAYIALTILLSLNGVATSWFVFGLWPRSWFMYALFTMFSLVIILAMQAITNKSK